MVKMELSAKRTSRRIIIGVIATAFIVLISFGIMSTSSIVPSSSPAKRYKDTVEINVNNIILQSIVPLTSQAFNETIGTDVVQLAAVPLSGQTHKPDVSLVARQLSKLYGQENTTGVNRSTQKLNDMRDNQVSKSQKTSPLTKREDVVTQSKDLTSAQQTNARILSRIKKHYPQLITRLSKPLLPDYKNPCFLEKDGVMCLPYFYLAGFPKAATTDLWWNILRHPDVTRRPKEGSWWTNIKRKTYWDISNYLEMQHKLVIRTSKSLQARNRVIIGDGSASTMWDNHKILKLTNTYERGELPFTWADVIHNVQPGAKIIAILRHPTNRTISDYFAFGKKQSPEDFHYNIQKEIKRFNECLKTRRVRTCANLEYYPRIQVSVYVAHITDWLRVYPRKQLLILRTEDWHKHRKLNILPEVFKFLEIDPISETQLRPVGKMKQSVTNKEATEHGESKFGEILPATRLLLNEFYQPYNEQLTQILADDKFLWSDLS